MPKIFRGTVLKIYKGAVYDIVLQIKIPLKHDKRGHCC